MLGFHKRTRSLIPVKDLSKYDRVSAKEADLYVEDEEIITTASFEADRSRSRQLMLVYLVFLAEA